MLHQVLNFQCAKPMSFTMNCQTLAWVMLSQRMMTQAGSCADTDGELISSMELDSPFPLSVSSKLTLSFQATDLL